MKEKRKHNSLCWWWPVQQIDYVVDAPIHDVIEELKLENERDPGWFFNRQKLLVTIKPRKVDQIYDLRFQRDMGKNLNIELVAEVESITADSTRINGEVHITRSTLIPLVILFCTHVLGVGVGLGVLANVPFGMIFGAISLLIFWVMFNQMRSGLHELLLTLDRAIEYAVAYTEEEAEKEKTTPYEKPKLKSASA